MQKTARNTAPVLISGAVTADSISNPMKQMLGANAAQRSYDIQRVTGISPYVTGGTYQPTITWQDTTSNATYSSAANVMSTEDFYSKQG